MAKAAGVGARADGGALRTVSLPRGGVLVIRPVDAGDVEGLEALYAGLDADSRYRRFFSAFRPGRDFFEPMVRVAERGGFGLVATVRDAGADPERIVGEAAYELLPDGDGELQITVDGRWRGWLGPYLLDALVEAAAARGVPNLEADVLLTNGPMLALLRSRGYATVPNGDWTILRAVIGAATRTPAWPGPHGRLRVLVEGAGGRWVGAAAARDAGIEVLGCAGPATPGRRCPALAGQPCPLAAGSDAIIVSAPADTEGWRALRDAHPRLHPGVPVCVQLHRGDAPPGPGETALPAGDARDVVAFVQRLAGARAGGQRRGEGS